MTKRIQKGFVAVLALAALAVGGSAVASAASSPATTPPAAEAVGGPDHDTIQSGDQTTPDVGTMAADASKSSATAAGEQPGTESSTEAPGAAESSTSESAPGNDGPGGHADEPGNPQANNQFQGQQ